MSFILLSCTCLFSENISNLEEMIDFKQRIGPFQNQKQLLLSYACMEFDSGLYFAPHKLYIKFLFTNKQEKYILSHKYISFIFNCIFRDYFWQDVLSS